MLMSESSSVVILRAVQFKIGVSSLDQASFPILDQVLELLKSRPELRLGVYGYSDNEGSSAQRLRLSQQRAAAVARYLTQHGIDPKRLQVEGFGDQRPIATTNTQEGRAQNRRVEFKILQ